MTNEEKMAALRLGGAGTRIVAFYPGEGMLVGELISINRHGAIRMRAKGKWDHRRLGRYVGVEQIRHIGEKKGRRRG